MRKRIGEILVETGTLDGDTLNRALEEQRRTGKRLGQILEEMGVVSERDIAAVIARQFRIKNVTQIAKYAFPPEVLALVTAETALEKLIFPLKRDGGKLYLAMVNPLDMSTVDEVSFRSGLQVVPCVTTPHEILQAVSRHYRDAGQEEADDNWWTILVVDDHEMVRAACTAALKKEGYILLEAANGAEGLKLACQHSPHLIISDTVMPRMDGYDMFRALKANSDTREIPVVALSSRSSAEEEARLLEAGYFDFVAKPINPIRLVARTKRALKTVYGDGSPPER